ncbi:MAG: hypothetical protein CML55_03310 [Rhodobacteraceae bacterium]|nr:hypothetical protein [Paracoccaceae bacterium]
MAPVLHPSASIAATPILLLNTRITHSDNFVGVTIPVAPHRARGLLARLRTFAHALSGESV